MRKIFILFTSLLGCSLFVGANHIEAKVQKMDDPYILVNYCIGICYEMLNCELQEIAVLKNTEEYIIQYNEITEKYRNMIDLQETIWDVFSEKEIQEVASVIETETSGSSFMEKVNVACVIFNRYQDNTYEFPDQIIDIVKQDNQFASGKKASEETIHAMEYAYMFGDTTGGALWFNVQGYNSWASRNREHVFSDNIHDFYK